MTNSKNLPASDLLKQFIKDRRDIADKLTSKNWVADGQYVVVPRDGEIPWEEVVVECSEEPSVAGNLAGFIVDARNCIPLQLQIIELQERAIGYALRGISNCGCAPEDEDRCRGCIARQAVNEIRDAVEALLKERT